MKSAKIPFSRKLIFFLIGLKIALTTIFCSLSFTNKHMYCVLCVCGCVGVYVVVKCIEGVLCINSLIVTPQLLYNCEEEVYCNLPHDIL